MKRIFAGLFFTSFILGSCHFMGGHRVKGNGTMKTETRNASGFNAVDIRGNMDLYLRQDSSFSVRVEADENLMEYIIIKTEGNKLVIEPKDGYNLSGTKDIKIYVSAPQVKDLDASGSCDIIGENRIVSAEPFELDLSGSSDVKLEVNSPKVDAELSGSGSIQLKGETKDLFVSGSGSTDIECMDLMAENVEVDISGSGNANVFASVKLNVEVSGSGNIRYKGNAAVTKSISGSGSITKVE